ncbi:hypothetical protein CJ430_30940, partial [Klebsiella pneumoniae]
LATAIRPRTTARMYQLFPPAGKSLAGTVGRMTRYDRRENLLMGTIAIGNRYQAEDNGANVPAVPPGWKESRGDSRAHDP